MARQTMMSIGFSDDESVRYFSQKPPSSNPLQNPLKEARTLPNLLMSSNWKEQIEGCDRMRRLCYHHPDILIMNQTLTSELTHCVLQVI
jgi:hypothetical protein